jgi:hypothetical protein
MQASNHRTIKSRFVTLAASFRLRGLLCKPAAFKTVPTCGDEMGGSLALHAATMCMRRAFLPSSSPLHFGNRHGKQDSAMGVNVPPRSVERPA